DSNRHGGQPPLGGRYRRRGLSRALDHRRMRGFGERLVPDLRPAGPARGLPGLVVQASVLGVSRAGIGARRPGDDPGVRHHRLVTTMADDLLTLWQAHRAAALPDVPRERMGELWVLDEVIGGCVTHYLGAAQTLDTPRIAILKDCRADLTRLLPDLDEAAA